MPRTSVALQPSMKKRRQTGGS